MNIDERMAKFIEIVSVDGINGVVMSEARGCNTEDWSKNYAIAKNLTYWSPEQDYYFDHNRFGSDFNEFLREHFASPEETVVIHTPDKPWDHQWPEGFVVINHRHKCSELEVYRVQKKVNQVTSN
jgi:hypothetical protein